MPARIAQSEPGVEITASGTDGTGGTGGTGGSGGTDGSGGTEGQQLTELRRLALRIHVQIRQALELVPPVYRPTSEMSRWLGVTRSICHWFRAAGKHEGEPVLLFMVLPGVEGLETLLRSLRDTVEDPKRVDGAIVAVLAYREAIGIAGGSQAKLVRLVESLLATERLARHNDPDLANRKRLFEAAAELCGARSRGFVLSCVISPGPTDDEIACVAALGQVDIHREATHIPLVLARRRSETNFSGPDRTLDGDVAGGLTPGAIIGRFSSLPLPIITSESRDRSHVQVLDPERSASDPLTVFIGQRFGSKHPRLTKDRVFVVSAIPRIPTRLLVLDLHVHPAVRFAGVPQAIAQYIGVEGAIQGHPDCRWYDRVGSVPSVRTLEPGPGTLASDAFAETEALTDFLLEQISANRSNYNSWRMEVPYPMWGLQYLLTMAPEDAGPVTSL